jgi:DNA-binding CsgD family transcriptional regulator
MEIKYQITPNIINSISTFSLLYGKLIIGIKSIDKSILDTITKENNRVSTFAATCMDNPTNLSQLEKISTTPIQQLTNDSKQIKNFEYFLNCLHDIDKIFGSYEQIDSSIIEKLAKKINPNSNGWNIRSGERILTIQELKDGIVSNVQKPVKTTPTKIRQLLKDYIDWIQAYARTLNPLLLSAITHIKIAEIHPFEDGNGRLSRMMARGLLKIGNIDNNLLLDFNSYYYVNKSRYFELIDKSIQQNDITEWIEFFLQGAIESINKTMVKISNLTGGTIDLINDNIIVLTPREQRIVSLVFQLKNASGTEIAKLLKVSRQNISVVLNKLEKIGVLRKYGKNTGIRYTIE